MLKPLFRAIQNMGRCRTTPTVTTPEPIQNASALRRSENWNKVPPRVTSAGLRLWCAYRHSLPSHVTDRPDPLSQRRGSLYR